MAFTLTPPLNAKARFALAATLLTAAVLAAALTIASPAFAFADDAAAGQSTPVVTQSDAALVPSVATSTASQDTAASSNLTQSDDAQTSDIQPVQPVVQAVPPQSLAASNNLLNVAASNSGTIGTVNWQIDAANTLIFSAESGVAGTLPSWSDKTSAATLLPWLSDAALRNKISSFKVADGHAVSVISGGSLAGMFAGLTSLSTCNLVGLNTANAINMTSMFEGCTSLTTLNISSFKTGKCTNMASMFKGCTSLKTLDLTLIATLNVTDMTSMFEGCSSLTTIKADDGFETDKVSAGKDTNMFAGCTRLVGGDTSVDGKGTAWSPRKTGKERAQVDNKSYYPGYFTKVVYEDAVSFAVFSSTDGSLRFYKRPNMPTAGMSAEDWDGYHNVTAVYNGQNPSNGFEVVSYGTTRVYSNDGGAMYVNLSTAPWTGYRGSISTVKVVDFGIAPKHLDNWFAISYVVPAWNNGWNYALRKLSLRALDTSKCTSIVCFIWAYSQRWEDNMIPYISSIDVRGWDTSKVTTMSAFLVNADRNYLTLDLSSWSSASLTNSGTLFDYSRKVSQVYYGPDWTVGAKNGLYCNATWTYAANGYFGDNNEFYWSYAPNGVLSITRTANAGSNEIPELDDIPWIRYFKSISSVTIGSGISSLCDGLFKGYPNLSSVSLPSTITSINADVFAGCPSLTNVSLPDTLSQLGPRAFANCEALKYVHFAGTIAPSYIDSEGSSVQPFVAFVGSPSALFSIPSVAERSFLDGGFPKERLILGEGTFGSFTWRFFADDRLEIYGAGVMPSCNPQPWSAFCNRIKKVLLSEDAASIGDNAFSGCNVLTSINLPAAITTVGVNAFAGCSSLSSLSLPAGITTIMNSAFKDCTRLVLTGLPVSVTTIGNSAFENCVALKGNWVLPGLTSLGQRAFAGAAALESVSFSDQFVSVGESAFSGATGLKSVTFARNRAPQVTSASSTLNPASTLFEGNTQAVINIKWGDEGYNLQGWDLWRIRMNEVPYYDETRSLTYANNVRLLEAYAKVPGAKLESAWYVLNGVMGDVLSATERLKVLGDVKIILTAAKLSAPRGIEVGVGNTLTVYSQTLATDQAGIIEVTAPSTGDAAIGGSAGQGTGTINIIGGRIIVAGGEGAAGIGAAQGGTIGTVNISGGKVDATGGEGASGIGGATGSGQGKINITGGSVGATGSNAPGIGSPAGASGTLEIDVTGTGRVVATNSGGTIVVGSPDHPDTTIMDIGGTIIATTGTGIEPRRESIGCDHPVVEHSGVVLVVETNTPESFTSSGDTITLKKPAVLLVKGHEEGVEVSGGTYNTDTQEVVLHEANGSFTFTNSGGKKVTITAPESTNSGAAKKISLADDGHIKLDEGLKVTVDGINLDVPSGVDLVDSATGKVQDVTDTQNNVNKVAFNQNVDVLVNPDKTILSEENNTKFTCGFDVNIWLEESDLVNQEDKSQLEALLSSSKFGTFLDITLWYRVMGGQATIVHESVTPIKVKFSILQELLQFPSSIKRTFKIARVHNGEVKLLSTFDAASLVDNTATFASDKFSTFALIYDDEVIPEPAKPQTPSGSGGENGAGNGNANVGVDKPAGGPDDAGNGDAASASGTTDGNANATNTLQQASYNLAGISDAPATGDTAPALPLAAAAAFALIALLASATLRRRIYHK